MDKTIGPLDSDPDDLADWLGDARDGEFEFLSFDNGEVAFATGFAPVAVLGPREEKDRIRQPEGLVLVQMTNGEVARYLTVAIDGTLVPGTVKSFDADLQQARTAADALTRDLNGGAAQVS